MLKVGPRPPSAHTSNSLLTSAMRARKNTQRMSGKTTFRHEMLKEAKLRGCTRCVWAWKQTLRRRD